MTAKVLKSMKHPKFWIIIGNEVSASSFIGIIQVFSSNEIYCQLTEEALPPLVGRCVCVHVHIAPSGTLLQNVERSIMGCGSECHGKKDFSSVLCMDYSPPGGPFLHFKAK